MSPSAYYLSILHLMQILLGLDDVYLRLMMQFLFKLSNLRSTHVCRWILRTFVLWYYKNKCGSGHRKLRVCVVKIPVCSSYFCSSSSPSSSFSSYFFHVFYMTAYFTAIESSNLDFEIFSTDRQTDQPTDQPTNKGRYWSSFPELKN